MTDMVMHCPRCGDQHIDEPDPETGWTNPPHKSHLCLSCSVVWRVADVPTNGVAATQTQGKADNWFPPLALAVGAGIDGGGGIDEPCTHPHAVRQGDEVFCSDCGFRCAHDDDDAPECV